MAECAFCNVVDYTLTGLSCSHLTTIRRTTVVCEGFVRREGCVYVATDKVSDQHLLSSGSVLFRLKLGPIRSGKSISVLVIFPMVSIIVDYVQKLRNLSAKASLISSSPVNCSSGSRVTGN